MITPSMKLSQLEMALGMETLAPGLLIFCFLIDCQILQGFHFSKKWRGDVVVYIHGFLTVHLISGRTTHT